MEPTLLDNLFTLVMLVMLQAVLGFDNLLYISLESKNAPPDRQAYVRKIGIGLAIFLRIGLLFLLIYLKDLVKESIWDVHIEGVFEMKLTVHSLIVLLGGGFIVYTAIKEIWHMIAMHGDEGENHERVAKSTNQVIFMIVIMNLVFSFDSILSAMALSDVLWVMSTAIVIGGLLMIWLADRVSTFLAKNRMYEVLGLFILFLVGIMLLSEAGHLAHISLGGSEIVAMSKGTFYFVLIVLVLVDVVQSKYQKNLIKKQDMLSKKASS